MQSFYGVYSTLFEKLARQEAEAFKNRDDIDEDSRRDCPSFPRCEGAGSLLGSGWKGCVDDAGICQGVCAQ